MQYSINYNDKLLLYIFLLFIHRKKFSIDLKIPKGFDEKNKEKLNFKIEIFQLQNQFVELFWSDNFC